MCAVLLVVGGVVVRIALDLCDQLLRPRRLMGERFVVVKRLNGVVHLLLP